MANYLSIAKIIPFIGAVVLPHLLPNPGFILVTTVLSLVLSCIAFYVSFLKPAALVMKLAVLSLS